MKLIYKILRSVIVTLLILLAGLPISLYLLMSLPGVQNKLRTVGEDELTTLLGAPVSIGRVSLSPFTRVSVHDAVVTDLYGDTALHVHRLGAGFSLSRLLFDRKLVVNYVELIGADLHVSRDSVGAPLNIQNIIDALGPKEPKKTPARFDLQVNTVVLRRINATYDVWSAPDPEPGRFDANHIAVNDFRADIGVPRLRNDDFLVNLKRLSANERSGLTVTTIEAELELNSRNLSICNPMLAMPHTLLRLADIEVPLDGIQSVGARLRDSAHRVAIFPESHVYLPDLAPLVPQLASLVYPIKIDADVTASAERVSIDKLNLSVGRGETWLRCEGSLDSLKGTSGPEVHLRRLQLAAATDEIDSVLVAFTHVPDDVRRMINKLGRITLSSHLDASMRMVDYKGSLSTDAGAFDLRMNATSHNKWHSASVDCDISTEKLEIGSILGRDDLGSAGFDLTLTGILGRNNHRGRADCVIRNLQWKGRTYSDLAAVFGFDNGHYSGALSIDDDAVSLQADGELDLTDHPGIDATVFINHVKFAELGLGTKYPDHVLSARIDADFQGKEIDTADGHIVITDLQFDDGSGNGLSLPQIVLAASNTTTPQWIDLDAGFLKGRIDGSYSFGAVAPGIRAMLAQVFPSLFDASVDTGRVGHVADNDTAGRPNRFDYNITLQPNRKLENFLKLPVNLLYKATVSGSMDVDTREAYLSVELPYLQQKNKLIKNSALRARIDGSRQEASIYATTLMQSKYGDVNLNLTCRGATDRMDTGISWRIKNKRDFHGDINLSAAIDRNDEGKLTSLISVNPGELVFNDTVWNIAASTVDVQPERITVKNFDISRPGQMLTIDGVASADSTELLTVKLKNIDLDYVFGTLNIDNVMFGGIASGTFYGSSLLSGAPRMHCPLLDVKGLKYNDALMGDTKIESAWHNENKGISIDAEISQNNGCKSYINGYIYPLSEELDFYFNAEKANVAFLQPFMAAFASKVAGTASGNAHLYGTFKLLDMTGDLYADDFKVTLAFTNTTYSATDSVRMRPGSIEINNLTVRDRYGNTAKLNGWLSHKFFKTPEFDFNLVCNRDFLCYDMPRGDEHPWFGRVFGVGQVFIDGRPGEVNITVDMATCPNSTFTFELRDTEVADEYSFITFRDRNEVAITDTLSLMVGSPELDRLMQQKVTKAQQEAEASDYVMKFLVHVTPDTEINLVMDPVGGDCIVTRGNGDMHMEYESANDVLRMQGDYTLESGTYDFTLQDIIRKTFTIKPGSVVEFRGDPYAAQLNIAATSTVMANLSDLDESFLTDKDLSRTSVQVNALLLVSGDIRQPDIKFDLEFPTMKNNDVYRKVRSIVSTDDMMNRQIIYLLALGRFYTPDYMAGATKGNELVSVASSTISSQLSNILGQLSNNFSVAPTVRSDRGDFSDVEVDVALSSTLLNNRLLLNGNLGYRDKTYNDNSFIGDFDIEYLLNRSGTLRLKAYNRYNDQNYYLRTALTTQGIGVVLKRDFDSLTDFLDPFKRLLRRRTSTDAVAKPSPPADTATVIINDTITVRTPIE